MPLPPSVVQLKLVSEKLHKVSTPQYRNGSFHKPTFSRRKLAEMRKAVILAGRFWPNFEIKERKPRKPPKLPADVRKKAARQEKIAQNMAKMPRLIEEWRKTKKTEKKKQLSAVEWLGYRFGGNYESQVSINKKIKKEIKRKY